MMEQNTRRNSYDEGGSKKKRIDLEVPCQTMKTVENRNSSLEGNFVCSLSTIERQDNINVSISSPVSERGAAEICNVTNQYRQLPYSFYNVPCEELARSLLGKILVRCLNDGTILKGRIVETECYLGGEDKASHSYNGKVTPRNKPMYMKPGTTYIYFTYGMYFCFNISSQGDGAAVLLRAVDPLEGHEFMNLQRINKRMSSKKNMDLKSITADTQIPTLRHHELCNGPGKLCISFCIDEKSCNMQDLCSWKDMWIEMDSESERVGSGAVITSSRIGIDSVDAEWALKPLRFYVFGNRAVSRRDRKKEENLSPFSNKRAKRR